MCFAWKQLDGRAHLEDDVEPEELELKLSSSIIDV